MIPIITIQAGSSVSTYANEQVLRYGYLQNIYGCDEFHLDINCDWKSWIGDDYLKQDTIKLRHGLLGGTQSELLPCVVTASKETYDIMIRIQSSGYNFGWKLMEKSAKNKVYQDKKISEIVTEVATDASLSPDVDSTDDKYTLMGSGYTLGEFLYNELYTRAPPNFYYCFRPPNSLVFKRISSGGTKSYGMSDFVNYPYYLYRRNVASNFWTSIGWDISSDIPVVTDVNFQRSGLTGYATGGFEFQEAVQLKTLGSSAKKQSLKSYAKGMFQKDPWMNCLVLPVYGDPTLVPPFMVNADISRGSSRFVSGQYLATSVAHVINKSGDGEQMYVSYIICSRRGYG